jgi:HAD superfamily hydrolase (TIGR01549 family)
MRRSVDLVCLDAGGVLVFPGWMRISETLARHGVKVSPETLARAEPQAKLALDRGEIIDKTSDAGRGWLYFGNILTIAGVPSSEAVDAALGDLRAYHDELNLWEYVPADVPPALQRLRDLGLRLVVVSNANGRIGQLLARIGLAGWFEAVLDSHDLGVEKPDPRIFRIALDRGGAAADRALHVGDLYHVDVVGARAAGIRPVLLDAAGLYLDADCPRVASLGELADRLEAGNL